MSEDLFDKKIILIGNEENEGLKDLDEYKNVMRDIRIYSTNKSKDLVHSEIIKFGMPEEGMIFIKHPFLPLYLPNDSQLEFNICRCSISHFSDFISKIGATKWQITLVIEELSILKRIFSGKVKTMQGKGGLHVENETESELRQMLSLEESNYSQSGRSILTLDEYKKACDFYNDSYYLKSYPEFKRMLDNRDPNNDMQKKEFHLRLQISARMNEILKVAAGLSTLHGMEINTNYTSNKDFKRTIFMDSFISFVNDTKP